VFDGLAGVFIQAGSEPGKRFEFLKLRIGEFEVARYRAVGRALRLPANAGNGFSDIDRGSCASVSMMGSAVRDPLPSSLRKCVARSSSREWM
jgi:hypothetical protein